MTKEQQAVYYQEAERQRQLHKQLYPQWSNGDNYVSAPRPPGSTQRRPPTPRLTLTRLLAGQEAVPGGEKKSVHQVPASPR